MYDSSDERLPQRLRDKLVEAPFGFNDSPCWVWTGCLWEGYGFMSWYPKGRSVRVHRFTYQTLVGPIPEGLQIDHLCRVRACCNPAHLEAVTQQENGRRGDTWSSGKVNRAKTHCPQGHPYDEENTHWRFRRGGFIRECRQCLALQARGAKKKASDKKFAQSEKRKDYLKLRNSRPEQKAKNAEAVRRYRERQKAAKEQI